MKLFRNLIESVKPNFEEGGKLEKFMPAFDALETFLFVPGHTTHKGSHIRDGIDLKRTMIMVVLAMVPCLLFGMWNTGRVHYLATGQEGALLDYVLYGAMKVLPIVIVSYGAGLTVEFIIGIINKHPINEGFLVSGMLIPLVMPVEISLWMVAFGTIFAVLIGKEVFGGTGMNIVNVALTARAFLFFAYPTKMSGNSVWISTDEVATVDGFSGATALGDLASFTQDKSLWVFENLEGFTAKYSLSDSFLGMIPGSIGETSALACLIGAGLLLYTGIASWKVMLSFFGGGVVMAMLFNMWAKTPFMEVPALHQLCLGGFFFGMVFMATDPVTAAQTEKGKWFYGFGAGFLAILIRVFNPAYPEGVMLAILFMNVAAPTIDHYVVAGNIKKRLNRVKTA